MFSWVCAKTSSIAALSLANFGVVNLDRQPGDVGRLTASDTMSGTGDIVGVQMTEAGLEVFLDISKKQR